MAAPHVAGVAALLWSYKPDLTYRQVKEIILSTVDPVESLQRKTVTGGRLNANKAVTKVISDISSLRRAKNDGPVAICKVVVDGFKVMLDATGSFGDIQRYKWVFSHDGSNSTEPIFNTDLPKDGIYTARLIVVDKQGMTDEIQCDDISVPSFITPSNVCITTSIAQSTGRPITYFDSSDSIKGIAPLTLHAQGPNSIEPCLQEPTLISTEEIAEYRWTVSKKMSAGNYFMLPDVGKEKTFSKVFENSGTYVVTSKITGNNKTMISPQFTVSVLPDLPVIGIDNLGVATSTTAIFAGGVSTNKEDYQTPMQISSGTTLDVIGQIKIDPRHVGSLADILVVHNDLSKQAWYVLDSQGNPNTWDVNLSSLVAFKPQQRLGNIQTVQILQDSLLSSAWHFYFGYRLSNGTVFYSNQPIEVTL